MANDREFIIQPLITDNRLVKLSDIDPTTSYAQIGVWQPNQQASGSPGNSYPSYAIPLSEIGKVPTLQQVLDFNHDLVDGVNLQGTNAGLGNIGVDVNALGKGAASDNTGNQVNALGLGAAYLNSGSTVNAIGQDACLNNKGDTVNAIGPSACNNNKGDYVTGIGRQAADTNFGNNVIALGTQAGIGNTISTAFIISNQELPSYPDHNTAYNAISPTGIPGNTYLYYESVNKYIGAVRL